MNNKKILFYNKEFDGWKTLNDTVMGGSSSAFCEITNSGLLLKGNIVEEAGGFISCRSSVFKPFLNLNEYESFELSIDGKGKKMTEFFDLHQRLAQQIRQTFLTRDPKIC